MKRYKKIIRRRLFLSMLINPIFILFYGILFYEFNILCRIGKTKNSITVLSACILFFVCYLIFFIIKAMKKPGNALQQIIDKYEFYENGIKILEDDKTTIEFQDIRSFKVNRKYIFIILKSKDILIFNIINKTNEEIDKIKSVLNDNVSNKNIYKAIWNYTAIIIMLVVTLFYGAKIYYSSIPYNGKLAWFLKNLEDKRIVKLEHNNIYKDGINGIFTDINNKISMPEKLYVSSSFSLKFDSNGTITSFDTFLYGKNNKNNLESYLISYDSSKSNKIQIYLNGYASPDYNEDKLLKPLIDTMKVIPLKNTVKEWPENRYGILYYGKRSFGYNGNGVVYINSKGDTKAASDIKLEIVGYVVSVFVPGKENVYTPVRYNLVEDLNNIKADSLKQNKREETAKKSNKTDQFYLSDKVGYKLEETAAAAGSRSYSLNKTSDGGAHWKTINEDPFLGKIGVAAGITFLNDKLGFLCLSHSGGNYGELYRTEDGGLSYKEISFPLKLSNVENNNPFDLPGMPYEKDGSLNILMGQGSDGDYNGGSKALYQSKDEGKTWSYIREVASTK